MPKWAGRQLHMKVMRDVKGSMRALLMPDTRVLRSVVALSSA